MATYTNVGQGRLICTDKGGKQVRFERNRPTEAVIDENLPGIAAWLKAGVLKRSAMPTMDPVTQAVDEAADAEANKGKK